MKKAGSWWFPDHEVELPMWMAIPANGVRINGREAYQGKKQLACHKLLAARPRRVALDVGGHVGTWSYNLAPLFDEVHAFEPVPDHRACFKANVSAANVILHECALGAEHGKVAIHTRATSSGDSRVALPGESCGEPVNLFTLDSFEIEGVDFLKIDTEGFEHSVLLGAERTVREWKPLVCVEQKRDMSVKFGAAPKAAVALLESWGYVVRLELGGDFIMEHVR